jgi:hypothetical protein
MLHLNRIVRFASEFAVKRHLFGWRKHCNPTAHYHPEEMEDYKLYCRLDIPGENGFSVTIPPTRRVHDLKEAIILKLPVDYKNTKAVDLKLYRIDQGDRQELRYSNKLSAAFGPNGPPDLGRADHILAGLPESELANSALGGFPDNLPHIVVVPPKAVRSIRVCTYSIYVDLVVS